MTRPRRSLLLLWAFAAGPLTSGVELWAQSTNANATPLLFSTAWEDGGQELAISPRDGTFTMLETPRGISESSDVDRNEPEQSFDFRPQPTRDTSGSSGRIIDRIVDPTAWLMNFRFRESWNWPEGRTNASSEEFQFRPTIPFRAWDHVNILRVTVPYDVDGPDAPGLRDVTILELVVFEPDWGRWGVGPVVRFSPGDNTDSDSFLLGPAVGAVAKDKYWSVGFLMQNFFADEVAETRFQPILAYKFNDSWAIGVGEFEFRYDWVDSDWTQIPLGFQVDYVTSIYDQRMQFFVNPQYNFERDASNSGWTLFLGMSLLVPGA